MMKKLCIIMAVIIQPLHGLSTTSTMPRHRAIIPQMRSSKLFLASTAGNEESSMKPLTVVIVGATGQTGRRCVEQLSGQSNVRVVAWVRDRARVAEAGISGDVEVGEIDVVSSSRESVRDEFQALGKVDAVICATGFSPSFPPDPFGAFRTDFLGTAKLLDAAIDAKNVDRFVLVSSLLTNGLESGQALNPQYILLNAFGGILVAKNLAERYICSRVGREGALTELTYTILRPGGLTNEDKEGAIVFSGPDTLFSGGISRDKVAAVTLAAVTEKTACRNKIIEIVQDTTASSVSFVEGFGSVI